jgi:hypothetical protein
MLGAGSARWLKPAVVPLHYGVPELVLAARGGSNSRAGPSSVLSVQTTEEARLRAGASRLPREQSRGEWNRMQALENVTTAGIYVIEYAHRPGPRTRDNNESE